MVYAPLLAWRQRFAFGHGVIRRGGGPWGADIQVASSTNAGAGALVVAFTATVSAQSGSDFLNNIDPLFSGVLAHPAISTIRLRMPHRPPRTAISSLQSALTSSSAFIIPGLPPRATSSACFIISLAHTLRRAAICKLRCRCRTSHPSFARRSRICFLLADSVGWQFAVDDHPHRRRDNLEL